MKVTKDFPKEYKYTLGHDIKRDGINLVRSIYRANKAKNKVEYLEAFLDDFELIKLEGAQAGLGWISVLRKRENYRKAFDHFDVKKIAKYDAKKVEQLMQNEGIIRNRLKIQSTIGNAKAYLEVQKEFGSFDAYIWQFTNGKTIVNRPKEMKNLVSKTKESDTMSKDLLKRGFKFVGSTICYAYMQAIGMVDDHLVDCWKK